MAGVLELEGTKVESGVADFLARLVEKEMTRLGEAAQRCIPVPVLAMATVREIVQKESIDTKESENQNNDTKTGVERKVGEKNKEKGERQGEQTAVSSTINTVWNHVEFKTSFDFSRVRQILLGPSVPCLLKPGYKGVLTVLVTDSPVPMLFAYLYDAAVEENDLRNWVFINAAQERVRFQVDAFV